MFKNPFSFSGRIRRTEYGISFIIFIMPFSLLQNILFGGVIYYSGEDTPLLIFLLLLYIPLLWFIIAQNTKRCHDRGNSGFYQFIPFYTLWLIFGKGEPNANEYGENPKGRIQLTPNKPLNTVKANRRNSSKFIQKIKQLKFINKINSLDLSLDEIIILSVVIGVFVATLLGCIFGETIYYYNDGNRTDDSGYDYSEFHINYILLVASFIISTGLSYILLNRRTNKKL
ncbi:DUF805 domain-containing protein [Riemerella anatipestifer]|uniref:DUF805 domain-containing protein n=1 Tax=Riemerella anatipestifer TaxID=34085 RepID=UPI0021F8A423|nr:DUF805 domain-containing protein [Riemerella anatipestifer]MCW0486809.1 DUF805 domain-containing protein [Riemerella anatipestifer]